MLRIASKSNQKRKNNKTTWTKDEQHEDKQNSNRKIQRDTYLLKTIALDTKWWHWALLFYSFWVVCESFNGLKVDQGSPSSYGSLGGAWRVGK